MARLRQVAVTLVLIPVFLAVSLIPILPTPAHAASQAPPAPTPEDPLAQQPEQQTPEITIDVDVRDGHLSVRVVDIWGPGRRPLIVRSLTNAISKSGVAAGPWQWNLQADVTPDDPLNPAKWMVREPDGNRGTFKGAMPSDTGTAVYEKTVGAYATMDVHQTCVGPPDDRDCTADLWTVNLSKGITLKFLPNPKVNQVGQPDGLLSEIRDANGNVTTATWITFADALQSKYIEKLTDPVGRVTTFTYERGDIAECVDSGQLQAMGVKTFPSSPTASGCVNYYNYRVKQITDPYGRTAAYTYNASHLLTSAVNGAGFTTSYTYATGVLDKLLTGVTNARGYKTTIEWELFQTGLGRVRRVVAPDTAASTYSYGFDTDGKPLTSVTDARGNITKHKSSPINTENDTGGDILMVTDPLNNVTAFQYDSRHNVTQVTDPRGVVTTYQYNSRNKVTKVVQDAGSGKLNLTTTLTWDTNDNLLSVKNPRNVTTEYTYDAKHNLITVKKAAGTADESITNYTYFTWGGVKTVSNPRNSAWVWTYAYTARRQVSSITPPVGGVTSFTYDANDDQVTKTDGAGHTWATTYNKSRLVLTVTDPLNNKISNAYDANGNKTSVTDAKNQVTSLAYDSRDRLTQITDPLSGQTKYFYDPVGNLLRINNARATDIATFTYDTANRLTQVKDGLNQFTSYTYDANGNRATMQDRKGTTHTYAYDNANRLMQVSAGGTTFSYTYDKNGNRLTLVDGTGTTSFVYDNLDRLTKMTYPDGKTIQFAYDDAGNRTSLTNPLPTAMTYGYDAANRLTSMTQGSLTWTFGYDAAGNRTSLGQPNGTTTTYAYLNNNWLSSITHKAPGGATLQSFAYTYDKNGNRISQADPTGTTSYGYDALNRLVNAAYPAGYGTWSWTYDPVGNRLSQNAPSGITNYSYDANNRLTAAGVVNYSYDANGNLTSTSSGQSFAWDVFNRMTSGTGGGGTATYTYNGDGLKLRRIGPDGTTRYYHDGIRPIWEADGAGSMTAQLDRDIFGNLLSRKEPAGTRRHYHFDGSGSTTALSDEGGLAVATLLYDAWGNQRAASGAAVPNYRFTGAELDAASGLYHMGARFYDPTIGRWLSEDPVRRNGPMGLNYYMYASNNPLGFIDPTGLCDQQCLEDLNAKRQELAKQAIKANPDNPVTEYMTAREMARALEAAVGREAAHAAVVGYMKAVAAGADPDEAFEEVLLQIPTRQQVKEMYSLGVSLVVAGATLIAWSVLAALRGQVRLAIGAYTLGVFLVEQGVLYISVATDYDKKYYNGSVFDELPPGPKLIIRLMGGGP
jgi:RHS repeat-associated protein